MRHSFHELFTGIDFMRYLILFLLFSAICITANIQDVNSSTSGAPAGSTGSPGDGGITCTNCHSGPAASVQTGWITSNVPVSGYVPGNTYTITATVTRPGHVKFGFEVSPQNISGVLQGTLINTSTATQLVALRR